VPFVDAAGGVQYAGTRGENSANRADGLPMTMDGAAAWMSAPTGNGVFETQAVTSNGSGWIDAGRVTNPALLTGSNYQIQFSVAAGATTYSVLNNGVPTALTNVAFVPGQAIQFDGMAVTITGQPAAGDQFAIAPSTPTLSVFDMLDQAAADLATPLASSSAKTQATSDNLRNIDSVLARMSAARSTAGEALNRIDSTSARLDAATQNAKTDRSTAEDLDIAAAISDFQNRQTGYEAALKTYASVQQLSLFDYIKT
jgi:flagellar hook-associated protein 3 FlgL